MSLENSDNNYMVLIPLKLEITLIPKTWRTIPTILLLPYACLKIRPFRSRKNLERELNSNAAQHLTTRRWQSHRKQIWYFRRENYVRRPQQQTPIWFRPYTQNKKIPSMVIKKKERLLVLPIHPFSIWIIIECLVSRFLWQLGHKHPCR